MKDKNSEKSASFNFAYR